MRRALKILFCFILLYFLMIFKSYASIDQSKVVKLDDAKYQISYYKETYNWADLSVSNYLYYSNNYEYIIVLTNGNTNQPNLIYDSENGIYTSDIGLCRDLYFTSTEDVDVPAGQGKAFRVEKALELKGDIKAWVFAVESPESNMLIKGNIPIERPALPESDDKFSDISYFGKTGIRLGLNLPRDMWTKRQFEIKIGEVDDYDLLLELKNNNSIVPNSLKQFAKEDKNPVVDTNLETSMKSEVTYYDCYESDSPIPNSLEIGNKITQGNYYYIYVEFDDENGKYMPVESVSFFQAGSTYTDIWALYRLGTTQFNWDNIDKYKEEPTNTIDDNTTNDLNNINEANNQVNNIVDNQVNNIVENKSNSVNPIDNTLADEELPYTGLELRILYILFILLCVIYYRYKKVKFNKKN